MSPLVRYKPLQVVGSLFKKFSLNENFTCIFTWNFYKPLVSSFNKGFDSSNKFCKLSWFSQLVSTCYLDNFLHLWYWLFMFMVLEKAILPVKKILAFNSLNKISFRLFLDILKKHFYSTILSFNHFKVPCRWWIN